MSAQRELLLAIRVLDSHNRNYDEGVTSLGRAGSKIGAAKLQNIDESVDITVSNQPAFTPPNHTSARR